MRVRHLVLTDSFAGVERHVCVLANEQHRRGYEVEVWGGRPAFMRSLLDSGVDHRPASGVAGAAVRGLRTPRPQVIHAHMTKAELAGLVPAVLRRTALVATRHFAAPRGARPGGWALRAVIGRTVDAQIAVSQFVARAVDGESVVVYPGVAPVVRHGPSDRQVVLVVQRLQPEKNTDVALRAFAAGAPPEWKLEIVGAGPELPALQKLADNLGIRSRTAFLGLRDDVPARMGASSIFLAPCQVEGLGLSVLEAMAHGLPVVASRAGAHTETVGLAADARLFAPGDTVQAGALIRELCEDGLLRARYGQQLAEVQASVFTPKAQAEAIEAVYRRVLT